MSSIQIVVPASGIESLAGSAGRYIQDQTLASGNAGTDGAHGVDSEAERMRQGCTDDAWVARDERGTRLLALQIRHDCKTRRGPGTERFAVETGPVHATATFSCAQIVKLVAGSLSASVQGRVLT